jgi:hypothetical protein
LAAPAPPVPAPQPTVAAKPAEPSLRNVFFLSPSMASMR